MHCDNCGFEISDEEIKGGKVVCPHCNKTNNMDIVNESDSGKEKNQAVNSEITGAIVLFFVFMAFVALLLGLLIVDEESLSKNFFSTIVGIALLIFGIGKKKKMVIVFSGIGLVVWYIAYIGASNDFPMFIRRIQGADFIVQWILFYIVLMLASIIINMIICMIYSRKHLPEAQEKIYSDSDLMILRKFDRCRRIGYYIFKARVHGIIKYVKNDKGAYVTINTAISPEERREYCLANPQVEKILAYIVEKSLDKELSEEYKKVLQEAFTGKEFAELREEYNKKVSERVYTASYTDNVLISDIVRDVETNPVIQSNGGKFAIKIIEKARTIVYSVFWSFLISGYYFAFTKVLMGLINNKPVDNLTSAMLIGVPIISAVCYRINKACYNNIFYKKFVDKIIDYKAKDFRNIEMLFKTFDFNKELSNEEAKKILRAYVIYSYNPSIYEFDDDEFKCFSSEVFSSIVARQAAILAAQRASSDGGSGCSSCGGGCGGGCGGCGGGCGGCGD